MAKADQKEAKDAKAVVEEPKEEPKQEPKKAGKKGAIKVRATIRPMHSPVDGLLIPDEGGVLIKKGSWAQSQLDRGLLEIVE